VTVQTGDMPEPRGQRDDPRAREADYSAPAEALTRSASSATALSIGNDSFALSRSSAGSDCSLKWEASRTSFHSPPPRSGLRIKAKLTTDQGIQPRKYRGSFGSFQGFCDLANALKALDQAPDPSDGPTTTDHGSWPSNGSFFRLSCLSFAAVLSPYSSPSPYPRLRYC
jgi:hypothetical protein